MAIKPKKKKEREMPTTNNAKYHFHVKEVIENSEKVTKHTRQKITAILIANMRIGERERRIKKQKNANIKRFFEHHHLMISFH